MIVWFVPSLVGGAVAVSFIGLLLGPFYVIIMVRLLLALGGEKGVVCVRIVGEANSSGD
jgi:hypothetical protein